MEFPYHSRLFVGCLDNYHVNRAQLEEVFSRYGELQEPVQVHKGFAFVQFGDEATATRAMNAESGRLLGTRNIEIQYARGVDRAPSFLGKRPRRGVSEYDDFPRKRFRSRHRPRPVFRPAIGKVPIFCFGRNLTDFADYVAAQFQKQRIDSDIHVVPNEFILRSPSEKYLIYILPRNREHRDIYFCAVNDDGTSPGFLDTPLTDVVQFVTRDMGGNFVAEPSPPPMQAQTRILAPVPPHQVGMQIPQSMPMATRMQMTQPPSAMPVMPPQSVHPQAVPVGHVPQYAAAPVGAVPTSYPTTQPFIQPQYPRTNVYPSSTVSMMPARGSAPQAQPQPQYVSPQYPVQYQQQQPAQRLPQHGAMPIYGTPMSAPPTTTTQEKSSLAGLLSTLESLKSKQ